MYNMWPLRLLISAVALSIVDSLLDNNVQLDMGLSVAQPTVKYFVHVINDGDDCSYAEKTVPMCAKKDSVCRMPPGGEADANDPSCLAYNPSNMEDNPFEIEDSAVVPWGNCNPTAELKRKIGDPPVCKRDFQCRCLHGAGENFICAPADAVDDVHGALKCQNMTSACPTDKYCHYVEAGGAECGPKPYFL